MFAWLREGALVTEQTAALHTRSNISIAEAGFWPADWKRPTGKRCPVVIGN